LIVPAGRTLGGNCITPEGVVKLFWNAKCQIPIAEYYQQAVNTPHKRR
jgi:hypothetical protein